MKRQSSLIEDSRFALAYRVQEPVASPPAALLILLHGVGGNETNLADLASNVASDTVVVFPRGPVQLAPAQHAWFNVRFDATGPQINANEAEESRRTLVHFVAQMQAAYDVAPAQTTIAGFSQGGILSASVSLSAPECVGAFAVLAGRILPELEPALASRERLRHLQGFMAHGRDDTKLPAFWAERAHAWLDRLHVPHVLQWYPGGHGIHPDMARDFTDWLQSLRLATNPTTHANV